MTQIPAEEVLRKLEAGYFLPSLSAVALRLVELASNDTATVRDLATLIEADPSLTVRLLRLANSSMFRRGEPVTSIEQALFRVGFHRLRIMALSISLRDTFPMGRHGLMDYEQFWRHSLYRATIARSLAHFLRNCNPEEAFVAGLTQEIGLLILHDIFVKGKDEHVRLDISPLMELLKMERERFGIDHRQVGEAAFRYWQFPDEIIACQNIEAGRGPGSPAPLCCVCNVARELSSVICQDDRNLSRVFARMDAVYGLYHGLISDIIVRTFQEVQEIAESLNVGINRDRDVLDIMEKANAALARLTERIDAGQAEASSPQHPSFRNVSDGQPPGKVDQTLQAVAHEIRNPLTAVGGFVKRLSRTLDPSSQGWEYVQVILEETKRLEDALAHMEGKTPR
ncbi:MAG TPA: HDOD domain-containing protein [Dissulfurispiraceae bacterium]|nr:HDOD domain-containing protein [Dissulfurispiraceae bacterium]